MRLLVHGSGFASPFRNDPEELRCGKPRAVRGNPDCEWSPATIDWEHLGRASGGSTGAATIDELVAVIEAQALESIEELRVIGHSNNQYFALGGTITINNVEFAPNAMIGPTQAFVAARTKLQQLQNRFRSDGIVVLAGCGSGGVGAPLLDLVSHTLLRRVAGFKEPILYAIDGTTRGPEIFENHRSLGRRIDDDASITLRGKAMYSTAANTIENVFGSAAVGRRALHANAWDLVPDAESKAGDIFAAVRRFRTNPGVISAAEVGFRLMSELLPGRSGQVAGIGFASNFAGLRVVEDNKIRGKMTIDLGRGFIERLTPRTIEQRVRELSRAIDLVNSRRTGVIPAP